MRYKRFLIAGGVVVAIAIVTYATLFLTRDRSQEEQLAASWVTYVNAKGQEWSIPSGKYDFTVGSASGVYPKFTSGNIDPLDVKVGDIQKMQVLVVSPTPIASVSAEIENDGKTITVPLELAGQKPIALGDVEKGPYRVDSENRLVLNPQKDVAVAENPAVATAHAQSLVEYTYIGQWTVRDTHTKTYHTKFIVSDTEKRSDVLTLAWSDPSCDFISGALQTDCAPALGIEGADGTSTRVTAGLTITLSGSAVLAFNPGKSLIIPTGGHILLSGGKIQQSYLYQADVDGDQYAPSVALSTSSVSSVANMVRLKDSLTQFNTSQLDCNDATPRVYKSNPNWYATVPAETGTGGQGDYNCDGSVSTQWAKYQDNTSPHTNRTTEPWICARPSGSNVFYKTSDVTCGGFAYRSSGVVETGSFYVASGSGTPTFCNTGIPLFYGTVALTCQ